MAIHRIRGAIACHTSIAKKHGREREAGIIERQEVYWQEGETVLVASGTLTTGPWLCDKCNAQIRPGTTAVLVRAFPRLWRSDLYDYAFGYERQYFAMNEGDTVAAYGAE
jgi:hypothetical protein